MPKDTACWSRTCATVVSNASSAAANHKKIDGVETGASLCCNMTMYEDHKPFQTVTVLTNQPGKMRGLGSAYDGAKFLLEEWPYEDEPKLSMAQAILLKCLEGGCSAAVARVAFVEAALEADIFCRGTGRASADRKTAALA